MPSRRPPDPHTTHLRVQKTIRGRIQYKQTIVISAVCSVTSKATSQVTPALLRRGRRQQRSASKTRTRIATSHHCLRSINRRVRSRGHTIQPIKTHHHPGKLPSWTMHRRCHLPRICQRTCPIVRPQEAPLLRPDHCHPFVTQQTTPDRQPRATRTSRQT